MVPEQQRLNAGERANLVAYIDGELSEVETESIAAKLKLSMTARREVEALEKTWELLDYLPKPKPSPDFLTRTLSGIRAVQLDGDPVGSALASGTRGFLKTIAGLAVIIGALSLGYTATRWLWPDRSARLEKDLAIAEHLDEYFEVQQFDFLRNLHESSVLGENEP